MEPNMNPPCPACAKARAKYDRLDARMAKRGNFGIVPLPRTCKAHRESVDSAITFTNSEGHTIRLSKSMTLRELVKMGIGLHIAPANQPLVPKTEYST